MKKHLIINFRSFLLAAFAACACFAFIPPKKQVTIFLAGDSTMADKQVSAFPETGWGTRMRNFFDSTVTIVNKAQNGRSTKTFINEGIWQSITDSLKSGDYVLIQFGHNDEVPTKASYTPENDYRNNLQNFVTQVRKRKGIPVLITPVARRKFDSVGRAVDTHVKYAGIVRAVAAENNVMLIDLDWESLALLQKIGPEDSKLLFNHLQAGQNPNYPKGKIDDTHFNELGARKMAEIVLADLRKLNPDLNKRVVTSTWGVQ
jgi:lysophospholipase L1-like esterase